MPKAVWNGKILAEADAKSVQRVEGNIYFPPDSIKSEFFKKTDTQTLCPWKGTASYYTLDVDGKTNADAAWFYPEPKALAANIKNHIAFWKGVEISE